MRNTHKLRVNNQFLDLNLFDTLSHAARLIPLDNSSFPLRDGKPNISRTLGINGKTPSTPGLVSIRGIQ
jgi:hypothetical protein